MPRMRDSEVATHKRLHSVTSSEYPPKKTRGRAPSPSQRDANPTPSDGATPQRNQRSPFPPRGAVLRRRGSARSLDSSNTTPTPQNAISQSPAPNRSLSNAIPSSSVGNQSQSTGIPSSLQSSPLPHNPLVSSPAPSRELQNDGTPVPHDSASASITFPLQQKTGRTERRQWSDGVIQREEELIPGSRIVGSRSIHRFGHTDMTRMINETSRKVELFMWTKQPFMNGMELEEVGFPTRDV